MKLTNSDLRLLVIALGNASHPNAWSTLPNYIYRAEAKRMLEIQDEVCQLLNSEAEAEIQAVLK